jgi:hypothetical protein
MKFRDSSKDGSTKQELSSAYNACHFASLDGGGSVMCTAKHTTLLEKN